MSKSGKNRPAHEAAAVKAVQDAHRAIGWVQVVLPGGHRRMMTREKLEAWRAER